MARIRTIKPEFFLHEELFELERTTGLPVRLVYIGLWTQADRAGRFRWRPGQLKSQIMPYDAVDFAAVLSALAEGGFIVHYEEQGKELGFIPTFSTHQFINNKERPSDLPAYDPTRHFNASGTREARVEDAKVDLGNPYQGKNGVEREGERELEGGLVGRSANGSLEGVQREPLNSRWLNEVELEHLSDPGALCALHRRLNEESPQVFPGDQLTLLRVMAAASRARHEGDDPVACFTGCLRHRAFEFRKRDRRAAERMLAGHRSRIKAASDVHVLAIPMCD